MARCFRWSRENEQLRYWIRIDTFRVFHLWFWFFSLISLAYIIYKCKYICVFFRSYDSVMISSQRNLTRSLLVWVLSVINFSSRLSTTSHQLKCDKRVWKAFWTSFDPVIDLSQTVFFSAMKRSVSVLLSTLWSGSKALHLRLIQLQFCFSITPYRFKCSRNVLNSFTIPTRQEICFKLSRILSQPYILLTAYFV